jgi:hypothetical protein
MVLQLAQGHREEARIGRDAIDGCGRATGRLTIFIDGLGGDADGFHKAQLCHAGNVGQCGRDFVDGQAVFNQGLGGCFDAAISLSESGQRGHFDSDGGGFVLDGFAHCILPLVWIG